MIGLVFQNFELVFEFILCDNIVLFFEFFGIGCWDVLKCVDYFVEIFDLSESNKWRFSEVLGGQVQCVVVGCVLVYCLVVVLVDEFIGVLDIMNCYVVIDLLDELVCVEGFILVMVIYDEYMLLGNVWIICLVDGWIVGDVL